MSKGVDLLARGLDLTAAAVGYLMPLGPDRLEPMDLPHQSPAPSPPSGAAIRGVLRALGTVRGAEQLNAGGRGVVARMLANRMESTVYRELRSDTIARRRAAAGRTPAKPTRTRQWLYAGDQSKTPAPTVPRSMIDALTTPCDGC